MMRSHVALTLHTEMVNDEPGNPAASGILEQLLAEPVRKWKEALSATCPSG